MYVGRQRRGVSDFGLFGSYTGGNVQSKGKIIVVSYGLTQGKKARWTCRPAGLDLGVRIDRYPSKVGHGDEQSDHKRLCMHRIVIVKCPRSDGNCQRSKIVEKTLCDNGNAPFAPYVELLVDDPSASLG